ncbi:MAG: hypothetical protein ACOYXM_16700 [Actinomycetota bacterium]
MLHQHGIKCVTQSDGAGMISTGWTLWDVWGLVEHQAWDFIYDGYQNWSSAGAPAAERLRFVRAVFDRLQSIQPEVAPTAELSSLSPAVVSPASRYYGSRCWAASELLEQAEATGTLTPELATEIYESLARVHEGFMPPRTRQHFEALAATRGSQPQHPGA